MLVSTVPTYSVDLGSWVEMPFEPGSCVVSISALLELSQSSSDSAVLVLFPSRYCSPALHPLFAWARNAKIVIMRIR